jgi:hypothetical protein
MVFISTRTFFLFNFRMVTLVNDVVLHLRERLFTCFLARQKAFALSR